MIQILARKLWESSQVQIILHRNWFSEVVFHCTASVSYPKPQTKLTFQIQILAQQWHQLRPEEGRCLEYSHWTIPNWERLLIAPVITRLPGNVGWGCGGQHTDIARSVRTGAWEWNIGEHIIEDTAGGKLHYWTAKGYNGLSLSLDNTATRLSWVLAILVTAV